MTTAGVSIHPRSPTHGIARRAVASIPLILVSSAFAFRLGLITGAVIIAVEALGIALLGRWLTAAANRSCLSVEESGAVQHVGAWRTKQLFLTSPPGKAVWCTWERGSAQKTLFGMWLLLNRNHEVELALNTTAWREEDLSAFSRSLNVEEERVTDPLDTAEMQAGYPGALPGWASHITAIAVTLTLGFIALVVGIAITL